MVSFDVGPDLAARFRAHAGERTHLYGYAVRGLAEDWEAGGPVRAVLRGYEDAPVGSMLQLRLLAGVFRLVLTDRAPELAPYYPCLGGQQPPDRAWPLMRQVIGRHVKELRDALEVAPQTNEVGRAAALLVGLADLVRASGRDRVHLLELGASAGLNLQLDRYWFTGSGWSWGDPDSPVRMGGAVEGFFDPPRFTVVERRGCDLHPIDPNREQGRLLLTSFVWPFDVARHDRLRAALAVAAQHRVMVDATGAGDWLAQQLSALAPDEGDLTVVWNSVTELYWPPAEVAGVAALLERVGRVRPLGRVSLEYAADGAARTGPVHDGPELRTVLWEGAATLPRQRLLGTADDHGPPVRLALA